MTDEKEAQGIGRVVTSTILANKLHILVLFDPGPLHCFSAIFVICHSIDYANLSTGETLILGMVIKWSISNASYVPW